MLHNQVSYIARYNPQYSITEEVSSLPLKHIKYAHMIFSKYISSNTAKLILLIKYIKKSFKTIDTNLNA